MSETIIVTNNITEKTSKIEQQVYKYSKEIYLNVKNKIKKLSGQQGHLKLQRKKHFKGERMEGSHSSNRKILRILYVVYDTVRGKDARVKQAFDNFGHMKNKTFSSSEKLGCTMRYNELCNELLDNTTKQL